MIKTKHSLDITIACHTDNEKASDHDRVSSWNCSNSWEIAKKQKQARESLAVWLGNYFYTQKIVLISIIFGGNSQENIFTCHWKKWIKIEAKQRIKKR